LFWALRCAPGFSHSLLKDLKGFQNLSGLQRAQTMLQSLTHPFPAGFLAATAWKLQAAGKMKEPQ